MAYKLQLKRGASGSLPTGIAGEPLFTTDTNDLYIGTGASNQRYQKYIASGTSSQFLKGDGSLDSNTYYLASNPSAFIALTALTASAPLSYNNTTGAFTIAQASGSVSGFLSSTDWTTFNSKQNTITLTTTGTSGAATLVGATLNIPQYADQFVGTVTSVAALTLGTTGTDLSSTVANGTTTPVITLNVPTASATNRGALSSGDWTIFNNKQAALNGTGFVKISGTTISYDNSTYALDSAVVKLTGTQSISGEKTFSDTSRFGLNILMFQNSTVNFQTGYSTFTSDSGGFYLALDTNKRAYFNVNGLSTQRNYTFPNATGTIALTSDIPSLSGYVTGTGTTNYLPKWTSGSAIGNSVIFDNGTSIGIGTSSPTLANLVISPSVGTGTVDGLAVIYNPDGASNRLRAKLWINDFNGQLDLKDNADVQTVKITANGASYFNGGNIGIATTSPGVSLDVEGSGIRIKNATPNIYFNNTVVQWKAYMPTGLNSFAINDAVRDVLTLGYNGAASYFSGCNIGIGTTSPAYKLDVVGVGRFQSANYPQLILTETTTNTNSLIYYDNVTSIKALKFRVADATDRLTLNASGNLGLGVVPSAWESPYKVIQFGSVSSLYDGGSANTGLGNNVFVNTSGSARYITTNYSSLYDQYLGQHRWFTAPSGTAGNAISFTQAMTLDASGRLGIGVTSVSAKLHIGESGSAAQLWLQRTDGYNPIKLIGGTLADGNGFKITMNTTDAFAITSGGNVGIGNTSASARLHVTGNILSYTEAANTASLFISANNSYNWQFGIGNNSNFVITEGGGLNAIGTERLRITSGGNVGIGTTSPSEKLEVNGNIKTAAPSGGTAKPFKIGAAASVSPTSPNRTIEIEIDGTTYYLSAKTTND